jgi:hypothetical protein
MSEMKSLEFVEYPEKVGISPYIDRDGDKMEQVADAELTITWDRGFIDRYRRTWMVAHNPSGNEMFLGPHWEVAIEHPEETRWLYSERTIACPHKLLTIIAGFAEEPK